jgi:hypothetical protein
MTTNADILRLAWRERKTCRESDGTVNATLLAEAVAHIMGHSEWLDDEAHYVWEAAVTASGA